MKPFSWHNIWVPTWSPAEIVFRSLFIYVFLQVAFRLLGRKEWTRYSAFNAVVLFLIAVSLRMTMVGDDTSLTSGLISISTLLGADWLFSYLSYRNGRLADILQGKPSVLVKNGELQRDALRKARVSESHLLAQARLHGHPSLDDIEEATLERSGKISMRFGGQSRRAA